MITKASSIIKNCAVTFLVAALFISCQQHKKEFKLSTSFVEIDTARLQVFTGGEGENTVVFESGLGVDGSTWLESGIFDSIGQNDQVIAYDRRGYGKSSQPVDARGLQALVDDLAMIINKTASNEKVILVSHSLGGSIARAYAIQHPDKIKALLFIDPNHEKFTEYASMSQAHEDTLVQLFAAENMNGAAMEAERLLENRSFMKQLSTLPDVPVIVITSIKTDDEMTAESVADWSLAHESLGTGITSFTHIKTDKSGHFIYLEEPNLVIEWIRKLMK
ncbi:MAG: alpha/beta hydrolase [Bacteroidia bacterium]|nr:alpha/beta hydrolase [Bacteroidia bacterium]